MKKRAITIIIVVAVIGAMVGLNIINKNKAKFNSVKTATVTKGDINSYLSTTAKIVSKNTKQYFGTQSKVQAVNVKVGDKVKKGDILVTYETQDLSKNVSQAQIQYNNAVLQKQDLVQSNNDINSKIDDLNANINEYDKEINDLKNSKEPSAITKIQSLEQSKKEDETKKDSLKPSSDEKLKQGDNAIATAKISLDQAKDNLAKNTNSIVADMDGIVTVVNSVVGATENPSQVAIEVQNLDELEAKVSAGRYDMQKLKLGEVATIKDVNKVYNGTVTRIEPIAVNTVTSSGQDTTVPVYIDINDEDENLKVNFNMDIDILVGAAKNVIKVPAESIKSDKDGQKFVYVVESEKAVRKNVKIGLQADMDVEITEGLNVGDKVILNPSSSIDDGAFVKEGVATSKGGMFGASAK